MKAYKNFKEVYLIPVIYSKKETPEELREYRIEKLYRPVGTQKEIAEFFTEKIHEPCALKFKTLEGKLEMICTHIEKVIK